jgi:outer membrane protein insertion porin family
LRRPLFIGVACVLFWSLAAFGQETSAPPSDRIVGVRLQGSSGATADAVLYYLGLKVGDPYDPAKIRKNFDTLWRSGLFDDVSIDAERGPGGVTLLITVVDRPKVRTVEYTGNKKLAIATIKDKITQEKASLKVGVPLSLKDVSAVEQAIRDAYQENGFRGVTVEYRLEGDSKTEKKLVFVIDEGEKIKIKSIKFTGNSVFPDARLRLAMKKTKVATLWRVLSDKTVYNQANFDEDMESVKHVYQDRGYKDIVVKDPKLDIYVSNPSQKNAKKIKKKVRITIPLVEGEKFYFGKITLATEEGDPKVFPRAELTKAFRFCSEGSVMSRARLYEAFAEIEQKYRSRGYIYFFIDPQYQKPTADRRVDIVAKLFEGDQFRLGRLEFAGNTSTREKVFRREVAVDEGDILDMDAFKKSVLKISQLGYFKMSEDPTFTPDNQAKKVNVVMKGQETSRNELNFGAGYSGFDGFFGQFSFGTRNFLGTGELLSASAQIGKITTLYNLGYTIPWFHDKNQTVGASVYSRQSTYLSIDDRRKGFSVFYGRALGIFDSYSLAYGLESIHADYPVQPAPVPPGFPVPPLASSLVEGTTSAVTPAYRYDSTNDPFDPTLGYRFFASFEFAGVGGTNHFIKPSVGGTAFLPFLRHRYFGLHLEAGYVRPFGGHELPIFERYQIGGEQSIRGFAIGTIIPLHHNRQIFVDDQGRILGGDKYAILNAEYIFAQVGPVKLLSFADFGNTWIEGQSIDFSGVRSSAGLELRLTLPIFQAPLRFIYSWNLHPIQPLDQFGFPISRLKERRSGFDFSIGTSF